jgi:DNA replication initiation complex subunit (GINS family)
MSDELTYKRLRDLAREEKVQPGLVRLPPEFYASIEEFLSSKFSDMESTRSVLQMREFENAVGTIKEISSIRQQKILFKAIRSGGAHGETTEMTREEHELYDRFCSVLIDEQQKMSAMLSRFESRKAKTSGAQEKRGETGAQPSDNFKKVRFIKDVPAYKGVNNETFGPFKPGEESALPMTEAEWLLRGKLAENIE